MELFIGKVGNELHSREIFVILLKTRVDIENWRRDYIQFRLHSSLGYKPPVPEPYGRGTLTLQVSQ